jgi:hypothetical protein
MDGEFGDADAEDDFGLAFEGLREIAGYFRVAVGDVRLVVVELAVRVLYVGSCTEERALFSFSAWARRLMHLPRVVISLLMRLASSRRLPLDSVLDTRSLPARSTIFSMPFRYFVSPCSFQR